jgi:anti-sigma regulatory factor (Ser/Thr protein kinase)
MNKQFKRDIGVLSDIFGFSELFRQKNDIKKELFFTVDLVIEEIFTNMVKYNPTGKADISIGLEKKENSIEILFIDTDSEKFDPVDADPPDLEVPMHERKVGGLGIHLVREMVDEIQYDYNNRVSTIKILKYLEN